MYLTAKMNDNEWADFKAGAQAAIRSWGVYSNRHVSILDGADFEGMLAKPKKLVLRKVDVQAAIGHALMYNATVAGQARLLAVYGPAGLDAPARDAIIQYALYGELVFA